MPRSPAMLVLSKFAEPKKELDTDDAGHPNDIDGIGEQPLRTEVSMPLHRSRTGGND